MLARSKAEPHETLSQSQTHPPITLNFLKSTHKTMGFWPLHSNQSYLLEMWSRSQFTSHYVCRINIVSECKINVRSTCIKCIMFHDHFNYFQKPPLEGRPNTKLETMALQNLIIVDLLYVTMCEDPAWIEFHWNSICLRAWSHTSSHYMCPYNVEIFGSEI